MPLNAFVFVLLFFLQGCEQDSDCVIARVANESISRRDVSLIANEIQPVPEPVEAKRLVVDVFLANKDSGKIVRRPLNPQKLLKGYREYIFKYDSNEALGHFQNLRKKYSVKTGECLN